MSVATVRGERDFGRVLEPAARNQVTAGALVERFRRLTPVDPQRLRADVDALVDQQL